MSHKAPPGSKHDDEPMPLRKSTRTTRALQPDPTVPLASVPQERFLPSLGLPMKNWCRKRDGGVCVLCSQNITVGNLAYGVAQSMRGKKTRSRSIQIGFFGDLDRGAEDNGMQECTGCHLEQQTYRSGSERSVHPILSPPSIVLRWMRKEVSTPGSDATIEDLFNRTKAKDHPLNHFSQVVQALSIIGRHEEKHKLDILVSYNPGEPFYLDYRTGDASNDADPEDLSQTLVYFHEIPEKPTSTAPPKLRLIRLTISPNDEADPFRRMSTVRIATLLAEVKAQMEDEIIGSPTFARDQDVFDELYGLFEALESGSGVKWPQRKDI